MGAAASACAEKETTRLTMLICADISGEFWQRRHSWGFGDTQLQTFEWECLGGNGQDDKESPTKREMGIKRKRGFWDRECEGEGGEREDWKSKGSKNKMTPRKHGPRLAARKGPLR